MRAPLAAVVAVTLLGLGRPAQSTPGSAVLVIHAWGDPFAAETARHLVDQLEGATIQKTSTSALALDRLVSRAQNEWPDRLVVAVDTVSHKVTVVRGQDGTVLTRALDPGQRSSPYAVALAALELLDLAAPEARRTITSTTSGPRWSPVLDAGVVASVSPGHEGVIWMPSFGAAVSLRGSGSPWGGSLGVTARILGDSESTIGAYDFDYHRLDVAVRVGLGRQLERIDAIVTAEIGGSYTDVRAFDAAGAEAGRDQRWSPFAGVGLEGRLRLAWGFALKVSASLGILPTRARFLVADDAALEEGALRLLFGTGLLWELPE